MPLLLGLLIAVAARAEDSPVTISEGRTDANGVLVHEIRSPYQAGVTSVRVLLPDTLEKGKAYPALYVLPVEAKSEDQYGDGLLEVKKNDLQNKYHAVFVAPTFSHLPWYADHPADPTIRQETYLLEAVIPMVEKRYPVSHDAPGRLLLGFSKSGWGAYSLLLRHPGLFGKAAAWDAPLMMDAPGRYGSGEIFGTAENFKAYQVSRLLELRAADLRTGRRLILLGTGNFAADHRAAHALMERLKIDHAYQDGPPRKHEWGSGWVPEAVGLLLEGAAVARSAERPPGRMGLKAVRTFMYQIDKLDEPGAVERLAQSDYDLLVVEPTATVRGNEAFDMAGMVARLHAGKAGRLVLAYVDAGQAERFRGYWPKEWTPPARGKGGQPSFLLTADPDGWHDDFPVAYWDKRWQEVFATGKESEVGRAMRAGFDGLYLDWIDGYSDDAVAAEARRQNVNPAHAMVDFIRTIRAAAREANPSALIIPQNAPHLIDEDARYADVIDGIGFEDTWFAGKSNTPWGKPRGGDIPNRDKEESSTARRVEQYKKFLKAGKPVFTIDYCLKPENARRVYEASRAAGFVPLVTQVSLSKITETPPPALP